MERFIRQSPVIRRCRWQVLLVLPLLALAGCQQSSSTPAGALGSVDAQQLVERGGLTFVADSTVGLQLAKAGNRPCLLFFTAEWCTFCHQMEETAFVDAAIKELSQEFVCVLVDADREPDICRHFAVRGYPTIQFLAADGRRLHQLVGRQSTPQLATGMRAALERMAWLERDGGKTL